MEFKEGDIVYIKPGGATNQVGQSKVAKDYSFTIVRLTERLVIGRNIIVNVSGVSATPSQEYLSKAINNISNEIGL